MRKEKQLLLDEVKGDVEGAPAFVLTRYLGMDPNLSFDFRNSLRAVGAHFGIVKKRVFVKAAEEAGISLTREMLEGHIGVVYAGENVIGAAKAIYLFSKDHKNILEVVGGCFEGKVCSPQEVEEISKLPTKDEMRAMFIGTLEAPMTQTLGTIEALLTSVLHCLENKAQNE